MNIKPLKIILIIGDGMGDRPVKELNNRTPLEVANTPNLDELAKRGVTGIVDVISPGIPPGSAPAHLALLGYDPIKNYTGRGAFEAIGMGLSLNMGDIAFRCNFATVTDDWVVIDRRAGRYVSEGPVFEKVLNSLKLRSAANVKIIFKHSIEHRGALVLRGPGLSNLVSNTDPGKNGLKVLEAKPLSSDEASIRTAKIINEFTLKSFEVLKDHPANKDRVSRGLLPANIVLCRGAGVLPHVKSIKEKFNLKAACIAGVPLIKGICKALGFTVLNVKGATGGLNSDLKAKAKAAISVINEVDFIVINVKGTDVASHDGLVKEKVRMIERIDEMVGIILNHIDLDSLCISVTADHVTPLSYRDHVGDPTPILISAPTIVPDDVKEFNERSVLKGGIGRIKGVDLMPLLLNCSLRSKKFGE